MIASMIASTSASTIASMSASMDEQNRSSFDSLRSPQANNSVRNGWLTPGEQPHAARLAE